MPDPTDVRPDAPWVTQDELRAPFAADDVEFKPAVVSGNRALALAYADARVFMDRLDHVLGASGWQTSYEVIGEHSVKCRLLCKIGGEWVAKEDVGATSDQPDPGDKMKAAFSDALKRAAVQFGVGRYLYNLPRVWADYDPKEKKFIRPPALPAWALPAPAPTNKISDTTREVIRRECLRTGYKLAQVIDAVGCTKFNVLADTTEQVGQSIVVWLKKKPNAEAMSDQLREQINSLMASKKVEPKAVETMAASFGADAAALTHPQAQELIRLLQSKGGAA